MIRQALASDIPAIQRVRHSVRENRLVSMVIDDEQVREAIEDTGRGWVVEVDGEVVAFAIGNARNGNVWALFVDPDHEQRGYGRLLHDTMVAWLFSRQLQRLWLTTGPGTRAQKFYEAAGWQLAGTTEQGELRYEKSAVAEKSPTDTVADSGHLSSNQAEAPVEVVAYDETWPKQFEAERAFLARLLSRWLVGEIEHVGSTAVSGLVAKPVIDIMAPVESLEASRPAIEVLIAAGYAHLPYRADVMHWFCKPSAEYRTHHLHLVPHASKLWHDRLLFRDALRADSELAAEYGTMKKGLAAQYRFDREAYTQAKAPFVEKVVSGFWAGRNSS